MTILVVVLSILLVASLVMNVFIVGRAFELVNTLVDGGDEVENCLDEINKAYGTVGKIIQSPLASNDPQIVRIHKELKRVHDSLLVVANRLVSSWNKLEEQETTSSED